MHAVHDAVLERRRMPSAEAFDGTDYGVVYRTHDAIPPRRGRRRPTIAFVRSASASLIAAIDQGTTSSRCLLIDHDGHVVASHQLEHRQITPRPGWVEHDPDE